MSLVYMTPVSPSTDTTLTAGRSGSVAQTRRRRHCLYLGAKADAKDREKLQRWGITHILNATPTKEVSIQSGIPNYFEKSGCYVYKRIPVYDAATSNLLQYSEEIVNFIASGLCHGSVLVHCQRGVSRSATCLLFYLMSKGNMPLVTALTLLRRRRPMVEPIPPFMTQLQTYENQCRALGILKDDQDETSRMKRKQCSDMNGESDEKDKANNNDEGNLPPKNAEQNIDTDMASQTSAVSATTEKRIVGPGLPPNNKKPTKSAAMIGPARPSVPSDPPHGVKKARIEPQPESREVAD